MDTGAIPPVTPVVHTVVKDHTIQKVHKVPKGHKVTEITFINLSSLIEAHATSIFPGMEIIGIFQFRVTRNSDLYVDDEEVTDLRQALKGELSQRNYGDAVRIETHKAISSFCMNYLLTEFKLEKKDVDFQEERFKMIAAIVVAHSAVEARQILQDFSVGDEVARFTSNRVDFWTREECATCVEFGVVTIGLYPGVVCLDFFNA